MAGRKTAFVYEVRHPEPELSGLPPFVAVMGCEDNGTERAIYFRGYFGLNGNRSAVEAVLSGLRSEGYEVINGQPAGSAFVPRALRPLMR